jgi:CRP-like cAMP-binding protein
MSEKLEFLSTVPLFRDVPGKTLQAVWAVARERPFEAGEDIVREGESGAGAFVITEGEVEVLSGGKQLGTLRKGDHFGEMAVLDEFPRSATVRALSAGSCLGIYRWDFVGLVRTDAELAVHLLQALSRRLREADRRLAE